MMDNDVVNSQFDISYRLAKLSDHSALYDLNERALPFVLPDEAKERESFRKDLLYWRARRRSTWVAEFAGEPVGFINLSPLPSPAALHSCVGVTTVAAVEPEFRSKGIGKELLARICKQAAGLNYAMLVACVSDESGRFVAANGWSVSESGQGVGWVEKEKLEDAGERAKNDIVGSLAAAAPIRGIAPDLGFGFNRTAHRVLAAPELHSVWNFKPDATKNDKGAWNSLALRVLENHSLVDDLPLSTALWVTGSARSIAGRQTSRAIFDRWVEARPEDAQAMPRRLGMPSASVQKVVDQLLA